MSAEHANTTRIRSLDRPGDLGWVIMVHGEQYQREFGWNTEFERLVARIVADFADDHDHEHEAAWIAEVGGRRAGCVFCIRDPDDASGATAKLRILLVDPSFRGHGVGAALVDECLRFARAAGYRRVTLWTNDVLVSARKIYQSRGFRLISEETHHSFGRDLVGQIWRVELDGQPPAPATSIAATSIAATAITSG
ncbi:GNAT family N-acetyltransferase [Microlunatus elymi]|uniref:GNAT family N-acetyltransferase n=1 Tax=Microlunatus elymi TaxID=2596828 RepID=A0A516Q3L2_9ACTN|nr:GNAT family N-acetyltransferase [Microlunatus elymi]QDP97972.1 GNAT family N-acetyltransferase [Microlunatus elymi]